ncbi:MAG: hypothetical protein MUF20_11145 [Methylotetracoccus sp.]|nr:hypothetical protein [Methylotetracoccus sp.]
MKTVLKWALLALAAVGCWAAIQQAPQVADLPAVPQTVVTTSIGFQRAPLSGPPIVRSHDRLGDPPTGYCSGGH